MKSHDHNKLTLGGRVAKWWLALMGVTLFLVTVAPDYPVPHVVLGALVVVAIHLLVVIFTRGQSSKLPPLSKRWRSDLPILSTAATLALLMPLALVGVVGLLTCGKSAWHAYFCAVTIGVFTALCWIFPSRSSKHNVAGGAP